MRAQFQNAVLFVSRTVFPGDTDQPTICSHTEVSRLLHYRLKVIEAALLTLISLQSKAATSPLVGGAPQ